MHNACSVSAGESNRTAGRLFGTALLGCLCLCSGLAPSTLRGAEEDAKKPAALVVPPDVRLFSDLTFCTQDNCNLKLNVAVPRQGAGPFPTVVIIHGGGWLYGTYKEKLPLSLRLAQKGYVAVTVGYRLSTANPFPAQVHDVKCAVRWLRANAAAYKIDKERVGVLGYSSGGHLACMLGVTNGKDNLEGNGGAAEESSRVGCVVSCAGLTDLAHLHQCCTKGELNLYGPFMKFAIESFVGGPPAKAGDRYAKASPVTYASKAAAPTLLIHGTRDALVPIEQARRLEKKLREAGAEVRLLPLQGAAHDFTGAHADRAEAAALEFLDRHLKRSGARPESPATTPRP